MLPADGAPRKPWSARPPGAALTVPGRGRSVEPGEGVRETARRQPRAMLGLVEVWDMTTPTTVRGYAVRARSTDTFGRLLCSARDQHLVVDGPVENGCPGEAITPGELFLAGVASCGVELVQVLAAEQQIPLQGVSVAVEGVVDRSRPVRQDVTLFNTVRLRFELTGVSEEQGRQLIERFKRR